MARNCEHDCLELSFVATEARASNGIAQVGARLEALGLSPGQTGDIKIAMAEAINNVVEHAYAGLPAQDVQVRCRFLDHQLVVQIVDSGHPMPGMKPPDGVPPHIGAELQGLPEGGFGWFIIKQLASRVEYQRRDGTNRLVLSFDLGERP